MQLIQKGGRLAFALMRLAQKHGIEVSDDMAPKELNDKLQQKWFKEGYLRFQIQGEQPSPDDLKLLHELGYIEEDPPVLEDPPGYPPSEPTPIIYSGVLVLGALRLRVASRLHYMASFASRLYTQRPEFFTVYLLGSARPLDPVKESREVLCTPAELPFKEGWSPPEQMPTTEAEMMEFVWQQSQLPIEWKYELVNTPHQP
ncbi:MAG: hypothetical protein G01um1014106_489, partial [Parcubacteria group bacterium Gr01-1014_106]